MLDIKSRQLIDYTELLPNDLFQDEEGSVFRVCYSYFQCDTKIVVAAIRFFARRKKVIPIDSRYRIRIFEGTVFRITVGRGSAIN